MLPALNKEKRKERAGRRRWQRLWFCGEVRKIGDEVQRVEAVKEKRLKFEENEMELF